MRHPEHEKLRAVRDKSQACGEFVEWLEGRSIVLASRHEHTEECRNKGATKGEDGGYLMCGLAKNELMSANVPIRRLLAEFFEIDEEKLEAEKRAMLAELRASQ